MTGWLSVTLPTSRLWLAHSVLAGHRPPCRGSVEAWNRFLKVRLPTAAYTAPTGTN
jgi:hypothetical protein